MAGFGDKRQEERDLDELNRQLSLNREAKEVFPNISSLLGKNSPEDYYRFKEQPIERGFFSSKYPEKYKQDLIYGPAYSKANEQYKSSHKEEPPTSEQFQALKIQKGNPVENKALAIRDAVEHMAANAFNADILKSKNKQDFATKLKELEGLQDVVIKKAPLGDSIAGYYDRGKNKVVLGDDSPATLMHELGHAKTPDPLIDEAKRDVLESYLSRMAMNDSEYKKYLARSNWDSANRDATDIAGSPRLLLRDIPDDERMKLLNEALQNEQGAMIARSLSAGHFGDERTFNYPLDRTMQVYEQRLKERGFEPERPEESPKFERLRSIMQTLRDLDRK